MKARVFRVCFWGMLLLASATFSKNNVVKQDARSATGLSPQMIDDSTYINANRIFMFVGNTGRFARDLGGVFGYDFGTFYPYLSNVYITSGVMAKSPLYGAGLWLGGKVNSEIRVDIAAYSTEYVPGPMANGTFIPDNPAFHVYKLYADSLADNPNLHYLSWPVTQGAPVDDQGHPLMKGDQMLWSVFNDADPAQHTNDAGETEPLGIEIQQTVWASNQAGTDTLTSPRGVPVFQLGATKVQVKVDIVDTSLMNSHEYRVVVDTPNGGTWRVEDVTAGTIVVPDRSFRSEDTMPVVDGVRITAVYPVGLGDWQWTGSERPLTGVNWGGSGFYGGIGILDQFFVSDLTYDDVRWVEIRWVGAGNGQNAYRYVRSDQYAYGGFWPQDFTVWDVTPGLPERQINFAFVENDFGDMHTPMDSLWDPGIQFDYYPYNPPDSTHDGVGGREYFQIMTSNYSDTALSNYTVDQWFTGNGGSVWDVLYGGWLHYRTGDGRPDSGDVFLLIPSVQPSSPDTFTFVTNPPEVVTSGPEGVSIYIAYKLYNKGGNVIDDCYVSLWTDPDLGGAGDDLVGCDSLTSTFFCYNGDNSDASYPERPPALGFKVLYGPLVPSPGDTAFFEGKPVPDYKNLGLTSFNKFVAGTGPDNYAQTYGFMQGLTRSGGPYVYDGDTTKFVHSGDPVLGVGDLDVYPADRRMMGSTGPFTFNPGDSQFVLIKMAVGQGADNLASITRMREILNLPFEFPTAVEQTPNANLPRTFRLGQNYPNPFNPTTVIEFSVPERAEVKLDIYNILGRKVRTLVEREMAAGDYTVQWDGTSESGQSVATGVYLYRLTAGDHTASRKMLLLK